MIETLQHPTWEIHDASKLQAYMACPRKYFYEYVLGWRLDVPQHDLVFGEAWHKAMAYLLIHGYDKIEDAYQEFLKCYRKDFSEMTDMDKAPKSPGFALDALIQYAKRYCIEDNFEVMHVEEYGTVTTGAGMLHFRLDSVVKDRRGVLYIEHKTSKMETQTWAAEWLLKMQTNLYNHVLLCMYGRENVYGGVVNGTFFRKGGIGFQRVDIRPHMDMMFAWLTETRMLQNKIEVEYARMLDSKSTSAAVMPCFLRNTENCMKYNKVCPYHGFCSAWKNPLTRCNSIPSGFVEHRWNPADEAKDMGKELIVIEGVQ